MSEAAEPSTERGARVAFWVFVAYVAIALPLILFYLDSFRWFFRDDWLFLSGRKIGSLDDLFRPTNAHWTTLPVIGYRLLWSVVGLRSYVPYQLMSVGLHLGVAVLLRYIMRRAGVRPWLATVAAGSFVLFGPGEANIGWAFQAALVGALFFGLVALLLVDHDGPISWRDFAALAAGVAALMCSGLGTTMAIIVAITALVRRGWKPAALQAVPLGAIYLVYVLVEHPDVTPFGRPTPVDLIRWVLSAEVGTFVALGFFGVIAIALLVVLVAGLVLLVRRVDRATLRRRLAAPGALLAGSILFAASTGYGRWIFGTDAARASRYVYLGAALTLPALALAMETIVEYWRPTIRRDVLVGGLMALLLVPMVLNIVNYDADFPHNFFSGQRSTLEAAPRVPFAKDVPPDVRPLQDPYMGQDVTIGFLRDAARSGKLPNPGTLPAVRVNEMKVRLGLAQYNDGVKPTACEPKQGAVDVQPAKGTVYRITYPVTVTTVSNGKPSSPQVVYDPANGKNLTVELDDLSLRFTPARGAPAFTLCH